jgi:hypothetical protein
MPASSSLRLRAWRFLVPALILLLSVAFAPGPAAAAITIGPGPAIGTDRAGVTWYQDFQDWNHGDLKALDMVGLADQTYAYNDGFDDSRDLCAFYEREEGGNVYFRVDLYDLALGAENSSMNIYLAIDCALGGQTFLPDFMDCTTDRPWEICVNIYQAGTNYGTDYRIYDKNFNNVTNGYLGAYFNSQLDAVEFGITRQTLLNAGWNGSSALLFQPFTNKDGGTSSCPGHSKITDAFVDQDRGCSDGVLNGAIASTDTAGLVYYASIAHGNQSINRAGEIGAHIYDSQANTGISGGTGFLRTLDTHQIFKVPLNIHPSGTLTIACNWAQKPGGAADPQDGPSFLARIRDHVDGNQADMPGSLIGGVLAEHIMPYYEGPVNAMSLAVTDSLNRAVYGVSAASARVMHTPERVIRSQSTNLAPLDGHTFEEIAASPYQATYLDEVTHLHWWFYPGESCSPDQGYRHKVHKINGVYCFMINDREDQGKFGNQDGGMVMDSRFSLLQKAMFGNSSETVVVFDDWEALAGKSFDPTSGNSLPNNNPNQYHNTIRWAANHPWIQVVNLKDLLAIALANPGAFIIDHGFRYDLPVQNYEWLKHASENSYNYWYYNNDAGFGGNEQDFYNLVPVITGPQGDYHARGATPANDGPPLPSGLKNGDLNSPGTLMYEGWAALNAAPAGRMRQLGIYAYLSMIYETAWHEEDQLDYSDSNCYGNWNFPDTSWDGVNSWALRLSNHVRQVGLFTAAAAWADAVRLGTQGAATVTSAADLDWDGEPEYVLKNNRLFALFEKYGGRCVLAAVYNPQTMDAELVVGTGMTNPSAPGEEEYVGGSANRCSAFKEMNGGGYADAAYGATAVAGGWQFTSPDGKIVKTITAGAASGILNAAYAETVTGPVYLRLGLSPNPLDLAYYGQAHLFSQLRVPQNDYLLTNSAGGGAHVLFGTATWVPNPSDAGADRRNLALTEQVELSGDGNFSFQLELIPGTNVTAVEPPPPPTALAVAGPWPSPSAGRVALALTLPAAAEVRCEVVDAGGRRVIERGLGRRGAGVVSLSLEPLADDGTRLSSGVYFVRVSAGARSVTRRWVVVR